MEISNDELGERVGSSRSVMPLDTLGCTRNIMIMTKGFRQSLKAERSLKHNRG